MTIKLETDVRKTKKVLLYGGPGTLKTTTASQFPKPLIVMDATVRGAEFLDVPKTVIVGISEFEALCSDKGLKAYSTVVLDDFSTTMKRWCDAASKGLREPRMGYRAVYSVVVPALQQLFLQNVNVVITAHHVVEDEFIPGVADGKLRKVVHPLFPDAMNTYLTGIMDVVGYTYNNGKPSALVVESATTQRRIFAKRRVGLNFGDVVALAELVKVVLK
jgi:hypothetical protein